MGGQDLAALLRNRGEAASGLFVDCREFGLVGTSVLLENGRVLGIGGRKRLGDVANIDHAVGCAVPGVRIDGRLAIVLHLQRRDALGRDHGRSLVARGCDQPIHPTFQTESVDEDDVGTLERTGIVGCRLIGVRIAVGADQRTNLDLVAADVANHVGENREARHHLERSRLRGHGERGIASDSGGERKRDLHGSILLAKWRGGSRRRKAPDGPKSRDRT